MLRCARDTLLNLGPMTVTPIPTYGLGWILRRDDALYLRPRWRSAPGRRDDHGHWNSVADGIIRSERDPHCQQPVRDRAGGGAGGRLRRPAPVYKRGHRCPERVA